MSMYVIILDEPNADAWNRVEANWDNRHFKSDTMAFISADEKTLTSDIIETVGIGPDGPNGMVVQMDYFAGYSSASLAEWIAKHRV